ncbi:MAG: hypothetical protein K2Y37_13675 [Pirellulales bacterium]|nr:hypothetical protein [Pirellulales bacterium]
MSSTLESSSIVREAVGGKPPRDAKLVECERFIEAQLGSTRGQVKGVEIATSLLKLLVGLIAYFLLLVVVDHWVLPGGLGVWTRLLALVGLLAGAGWYLAARVVPLLGKRVNPVYAAYSIEKTQPTLKNSVINFLLLRRERERVAEPIFVAIEQRAASDLQRVPVEGAVDRSGLIRLGYVLVALVTLVCAYWLLSPKDPWRTFRRVAAPWADLAPATRVSIDAIEPGSTRVFQGDRVRVSARVRGVRKGEEITLLWSTADGQNVDQPIAMQPSTEGYASYFEAELPGGSGTLQQNTEYRLRAGDAESPRFQLEVVTAPAILVERVEYAYPAYADVPNRVVERQGDLQGIDGTTVTITARANVPIKNAYIDFDADGGRDVSLSLSGQMASGNFLLALNKQGEPEHKNYQVRFLDQAGHENPHPVRHTIEVLADQPPEIQFTEPGRDEVQLALNGALPLALRAADRDFKLRRVTVFFEKKGGAKLRTEVLLDEPRGGRFDGSLVFDASTLERGAVAAGDTIEYWAEARDNRQPVANEAHTVKHRIRITSAVDEAERQRQLAEAEKKAEEAVRDTDETVAAESTTAGDDESQQGSESEVASNNAAEGAEPSASPTDRKDPERDAAEAMEDIIAYRDEQDGQSPREDKPREQQSEENSSTESDRQQQPDEQQQSEEQNGDKPRDAQSGDEGGESSESGGQSQEPSGEQSGDQSGEQSGGSKQEGASGQGQGESKPEGGSESSSSEPASGGQGGKPRPGRKPGGSGDANAEPDGSTPESSAPDQTQGGKKPGARKPGGKQPKPQSTESGESGEQDGATSDAGQPDRAGQPGAKPKPRPGNKPNKPESAGQPESGEGSPEEGGSADKPGQDGASDASQDGSSRPGGQPGDKSERESGANPNEGGSTEPNSKPSAGRKPKPPQKASPQEGGASPSEQAADTAGANKPDKPKPDEGDGQSTAASEPQKQDDPGEQGSGSGAGDRTAPPAKPQRDKPQSEEERHDEEATGGDPNNSTGESGAGQQPENHKPSGRIDQQQGTKDKNQEGSSETDPSNDDVGDNASSPKPHESDSQGAESGDRQGGGQQGGGQKANKPGTGSAGENTAADQGSGQAPGAGDGDASDQAGNKTPGKQPRQGSGQKTDGAGSSGQSSQPQGESGSPSSSGQPGEGGSGRKPPQSTDKPRQPNSADGQPPSQQDDASSTPEGADQPADQQPGESDAPVGGNSGGTGQPNGPGINTGAGRPQGPGQTGAPPQEALGGEEANAEFARQQTDLVIESLKDQLADDQLDPELLKKLGWTRDDIEKFVRRWEALRKAAGQEGPEGEKAREQYERVINDLNLKRRGVSIRQSAKPDQVNRLRESRGSKPPAEYADQFRAYTEGATKAATPKK